MDDRTVRPVVCPQGGAHESQTRFSREHKNVILEEEANHDRTGDPLFVLKEERINSSSKTMKQNQNCHQDTDHEQSDEIYGVKTINWENSS